jgi:hypothetical protein
MTGMNLLFHIASAVGFLFLILVAAKSIRRANLARDLSSLVRSEKKQRVADWPVNFLVNFAEAFGVQMDLDGVKKNTGEPCPIDASAFTRCFFENDFRSFRLSACSSGVKLDIIVKENQDKILIKDTCEKAFGGRLQVEVQ